VAIAEVSGLVREYSRFIRRPKIEKSPAEFAKTDTL